MTRKGRYGHKWSQEADDLKKNLPKQGMCLDSPTAQSLLGNVAMSYFARALRGDDQRVQRHHILEKLPGLFYDGAAQISHEDAGSQTADKFWERIVDGYQPWARYIPSKVVLEFVVYLMQARREFLVSDPILNEESEFVTSIDAFEDNLKRHHHRDVLLIAQYKATSRGQRDLDLEEDAGPEDYDDIEDQAGFEANTGDTDYQEESDEELADEEVEDQEMGEADGVVSSSQPNKKRGREDDDDDLTEPTGPPLPQDEQDRLRAGIKRLKLEGEMTSEYEGDVQMGDAGP
ncbi:hypothetical protein PG985_012401 [Apiospora marii]|uniref:Uncharacterized protein n=1 Tax=Apiospora marii TaxID=335849 RepID=A0ABR1RDF6_9PEZI